MPTKKISESKKSSSESLQTNVKKLEEEIKQIQQDVKEKNEKYLRTLADFQNYQRRMEKEMTCLEDTLKKKYLSELLDFYDLLKKAYEDANPKDGLKLLIQNLDKFLEKEGITYIDCNAKPFDPLFHHAIATIEKEDCVDGTILEEVKKGYLVGEKLLRPSQVIVTKKKETSKKEG